MKKKVMIALLLTCVVLTTSCANKKYKVVDSEESESEPVPSSEATPPVVAKSEQESETQEDRQYDYHGVVCVDDVLYNIYAEGNDENTYANAKEYIAAMKQKGMGVTLADTLEAFNRNGIEYYGCGVGELSESELGDDIYSVRVIKTVDGDKLFYFLESYEASGYEWDDPRSGNIHMILWRINDDKVYDLLANEYEVKRKAAQKFVLTDEVKEDLEWELKYYDEIEYRIVKNSIYAAHGRKFTAPDLAAIFGAQSWYNGTIEAKDFDNHIADYLSKDEQDYVGELAKAEKDYKNKKISNKVTWKYVSSLTNGSTLDVNNDGKKERVFWGWSEYEYNGSKHISTGTELQVLVQFPDGNEVGFMHAGMDVDNCVYCIQPDFMEFCLATGEEGPSDDPVTEFHSFVGEECKDRGYVEVSPMEIKWYSDHIVAGFRGYHINTEEIRTDYVLGADGKFDIKDKSYYEYRGNTMTASFDIKTFAAKGGSQAGIVISAGSEFCIVGGDLENWVKVKELKTGNEGWVMTKGESFVFPDGTSEKYMGALEGLMIYD